MKRIAVIGCPGSGKSTLSRELAARTGVAVVHLDQLYWQPGWKPHPDVQAFRGTVDRVVADESWILDGGFFDTAGPGRFERADTVVLLDLPTGLCLYRALKRWWTYRGEDRPDLAPGCPEAMDLEFYRYILTYRAKQLPQAEALLARHFRGRLIRIRNEAERRAFVRSV
ncbi:MAG: adenylate kinase [Micropepsaceae bacterium]